MSGEKIVRALDAIPDEQLQSAMSVYERKKKIKYIWMRVIIALIVLAVVLFFLQGTASPWMSELNLNRDDFTEQTPYVMLPEATPTAVECHFGGTELANAKPDDAVATGDLAEELAQYIRDLRLTGTQCPQRTMGFIHLYFLYDECENVRLVLTWDDDGHFFIYSYDGYSGHFQLVEVQADYLMQIIGKIVDQSNQSR